MKTVRSRLRNSFNRRRERLRRALAAKPLTERAQAFIGMGLAVRAVRKAAGLSIPELAKKLGWPLPLLANFEAGMARPSAGQQADLDRWIDSVRPKPQFPEPGE